MSQRAYKNFVKASAPQSTEVSIITPTISGEEARRLYLEEIKEARTHKSSHTHKRNHKNESSNQLLSKEDIHCSNKDVFVAVENNDIETVKHVLDKYPDKISLVDDYEWSLLMIACQADAVEVAQELLKRGADISIRDKAGNSARSLVIKNKNYVLADVLINFSRKNDNKPLDKRKKQVRKNSEEFTCAACNKTFSDKEAHLSSTIHNISASKGKKIPTNYVIPQTNRGYQLLLKGGWDRESGLGKDGAGKKHPIKTVQKKDRKGLGHEKKKCEENQNADSRFKNKESSRSDYHRNKRFEINFRREFY